MGFLYFYLISVVFCWGSMRYTLKYDIKYGNEVDNKSTVKAIFLIFIPLINFVAGLTFYIATFADKMAHKEYSDKFAHRFFMIRGKKHDDKHKLL